MYTQTKQAKPDDEINKVYICLSRKYIRGQILIQQTLLKQALYNIYIILMMGRCIILSLFIFTCCVRVCASVELV